MPGCSAENCSRHSRDGVRLFIFPKDEQRRQVWVEMCKSYEWIPTEHAKLCEVHFEESQFETKRQDGWKRLKPNAIPTLFGEAIRRELITPRRKNKSNDIQTAASQSNSKMKDENTKNLPLKKRDMVHSDIVKEEQSLTNSSTFVIENGKLKEQLELKNRQLRSLREEIRCLKKKNRVLAEKLQKVSLFNDQFLKLLASGTTMVPK